MANDSWLIKLERDIRGKMRQIRNKSVAPKDTNIAKLLNTMKGLDEVLFAELIEDYKKILKEIK